MTEYGLVNLDRRFVAERVRALIPLTHPGFRALLACEARGTNSISKGSF